MMVWLCKSAGFAQKRLTPLLRELPALIEIENHDFGLSQYRIIQLLIPYREVDSNPFTGIGLPLCWRTQHWITWFSGHNLIAYLFHK
jgi:hypothetical protein